MKESLTEGGIWWQGIADVARTKDEGLRSVDIVAVVEFALYIW